ncbi:class I SAM-dependent methyltransferase [Myroides marinus]|uniref:class I SAM-dependent methyltransferase n=1 Tax=Myroides TaxID=76831 RepID=UPI0007421943|nr:class I SAM-dependent methyltransferase [Myroides marinus]KUF44287.1 methyltransferase [Myroides marinus]MDM1346602.1 class I SAM-dependent methyltransferase [Myroides marinus]MDM1350007.1 class I SAM-dependent methyltransferase [Myroides marinus]MDM1353514.1 class I SAM-dependent methyltransferase [Myroides marinus]MDM1357214.1 class I SAM-dependent methyltransferase [Myroides marinus]
MSEFWDKRYSESTYAYGVEPNVFFKEALVTIEVKGTVLLAAEGEGRNAVYAAKQGWKVKAFDQSEEAKNKALSLATQQGVVLDYIVSDIESLSYERGSMDALVLIYAHFPKEVRQAYHQKLSQYLKVGGLLIMEAFEKKHLEKQRVNTKVGGPNQINMLYSLEELREDFLGFDFLLLEETDTLLNEGIYHQGEARVVRLIAKKK